MASPAPFPDAPAAARAGLAALAAADPALARIEPACGKLPWRTRPPGFAGLLQTIVGQQISNQAAGAIWRRLHALPGALHPATLLALPEPVLQGAGLSRPKIAYARSLAAAFADGRLAEDMLARMDDAAAAAAIGAVRGLGPWSADIYLLFALGRPDVFPAGDLALAAGCADLLALPARPRPAALRSIAARWQPYRGLAARLLWHHWRHVTGRPAMDEPLAPAETDA